MPIGKDSIKTRVAKVAATEVAAPETSVAEATAPIAEAAPVAKNPAPAKSTPKKRSTGTASAATTGTTAKKKTTPKAEKPAEAPATIDTAVLANVAPETVEAMVGHKEDAKIEHVQVGQKMPNYLL